MMAFDEHNCDHVLAREIFVDLFENAARMLAHDLFVHGRAVAEIRRTRDGKVVGLDPVNTTTIFAVHGAVPGTIEYENRLSDCKNIRISADNLLVLTRDAPESLVFDPPDSA